MILAGGASRRFPPNKLLESYGGEPLFWSAVRAADAVCDTIVVVLPRNRPEPALPSAAHSIVIAHDAMLDQGPLVGLLAGLEATRTEWALVVGGDMPRLGVALLGAMIERAAASDADAVALVADGRAWPMPAVLRVAAARSTVAALVRSGERRLRACLESLRVESLGEDWWRELDGEAAWRVDVDRPADLV